MAQYPSAGGGGGGVISVNGDTGPVIVLTPAEVGALATASNLSDLASVSTARTNLGLSGAALLAVGTTTGTVAAGDDSRITGAAQKASNLSDLASASTARTNLGLSALATAAFGTTAGTATEGNDSRVTGAAQKASNLSDLASASTSRTNLGVAYGTTAGTVAQGNDSRITGAIQSSEKGAASGVVPLDGTTKIDQTYLPGIALTSTTVVANQAAMLALTAQPGDVAVRSDLNKTFILTVSPATVLGNWQELLTPTDSVTSVNGNTGAVSVTPSGIGALAASNNFSDVASTATARTNLGLGTAAVTDTGTGASNTILGNDARLADARTPTAHSHPQSDVTNLVTDLGNKASSSALTTHTGDTANPHAVTKTQVGLGNVTNDAQLKSADLDTDGTLAANSATKVPAQSAVKTYSDTKLSKTGTASQSVGGSVTSTPVTLTDAATITVDASLGNIFRVTLGGNRTLGNPTGGVDGQVIRVVAKQDATGSRTLAYDTAYAFSTDLPSPTLTTAANAVDILVFSYRSGSGKWLLIGKNFGFGNV